ncbi:puromycin-sensitive aminopeptidase [Stylonychia lemnae]|uniref:Puromycin-sensitive aminopeptidase n=1 Tax=Stylonychia lemnae TaxID=5949 RepID=A0A078AAL7_STYLE|nr:puromycin-sensitive aminopeptidase [Stylonychia lemnae]|eukprot:CDW78632.1 puromycin-sensitive aminopeptidase [Stylonychia lemnae]
MESLELTEVELKGRDELLFRLPLDVKPLQYDLRYVPKIQEKMFYNELTIKIFISSKKDIDEVNLHMKDLQVNSLQIIKIVDGSEKIYETSLTKNENYIQDTFSIKFLDQEIKFEARSEYFLRFQYQGKIKTHEMTGINFFSLNLTIGVFMLCDPKLLDNKEKQMFDYGDELLLQNNEVLEQIQICTHFEDKFARQMLPCFDEPLFKSVFNVIVEIEYENHDVISNSLVKEITKTENKKVYTFDSTPLMSTYLLCIVIGKFDKNTLHSKSGVQVSTYLPTGEGVKSLDALQLAADSIDFLEDYFQVKYPLTKLDLIGYYNHIVRAMENWGCVTFIKKLLIKEEGDEFDEYDYKRNCKTIAHEISHMWFGNLVTMEWWDDIWLNEGFARYMEHVILDKIRPELKIWLMYIEIVYSVALRKDKSIALTHPVQVKVKGDQSLDDIFDTISYAKGSAIVLMMQAVIQNEQVFQDCLRAYMNRFMWKNATSQDLFQVMEEVSAIPIMDIFTHWIQTPCFPILVIDRISEDTYTFWQKCYDSMNSVEQWTIPVKFVTSKGQTGFVMLDQKMSQVKIEGLQADEYTKFNHNALGFFICYYVNQSEVDGLYYSDFMGDIDRMVFNLELMVSGKQVTPRDEEKENDEVDDALENKVE